MSDSEPTGEIVETTAKCYDNEILYRKCHKELVRQTNDVQFVFDTENGAVKIPANKNVLSAVSPVFNAMFNGDLKEKGDVPIVDASPAAFKEFLEFFYDSQVKLTMDHIAEVLKLIDKYDVADGFPVCADFLKDNITIDDILWGLHLAIKFKLEDFESFCKNQIQGKIQIVLDQLKFDDENDDGEKNRLSKVELVNILPCIFEIQKKVNSNNTIEIDRLQKRQYFPITLSSNEHGVDYVTSLKTIVFLLNKNMLLTDISCYDVCNNIRKIKMIIEENENVSVWGSNRLYTGVIRIVTGENHIKLPNPISINPNYFYGITFQTSGDRLRMCKAIIPQSSVTLTPGVQITFPQTNGPYTHSLISQLHFTYPTDN